MSASRCIVCRNSTASHGLFATSGPQSIFIASESPSAPHGACRASCDTRGRQIGHTGATASCDSFVCAPGIVLAADKRAVKEA